MFVDILGFASLADAIAISTGYGKADNKSDDKVIDSSQARQDWLLKPIRDKIEDIKTQRESGDLWVEPGSDDFKLMISDIGTVFEILQTLTAIEIPFKGFKFIPLELALDVKEISNLDDNVELVTRNEVIMFLKNDIVTPYRQFYKDTHDGKSTHDSFLVITKQLYDDLGPLDRKYCMEVSHEDKRFFVADFNRMIHYRELNESYAVLITESKSYDYNTMSFSNGVTISEIEQKIKAKKIYSLFGKELPPPKLERLWLCYNCDDLTAAGGFISKKINEKKDNLLAILLDANLFDPSADKSRCLDALLHLFQSLPSPIDKVGIAAMKSPRVNDVNKDFKPFLPTDKLYDHGQQASDWLLGLYRDTLTKKEFYSQNIEIKAGRHI